MGLRSKILSVAIAAIFVATISDTAFPQARNNAPAQPADAQTLQAKAWGLFYAGKYQSAASAVQPLLKSDKYEVQSEAMHLFARCLWSANTGSGGSGTAAQKLWKQLDKPLAGSSVHLRLDIAKALVLDSQSPPKTTEAIELLERDFILQGNSGGTAQAEAAIELAALYAEDGKPDKAGKLLDAVPQFFAAANLPRLEIDPPDIAPFLSAAAAAKAGLNANHPPASPGQAEFQHAEALRASGRYQDAFKAYQAIIAKYPDTDYAPHSDLCLGYCLLGNSGGSGTVKAIDHWKQFVAASPSGPWRGQAYVALIDTSLDPLLDLGEAEKQADAAAKAMSSAMDDEKSAPSWKLAEFDLQVRLGTVRLLQNQSQPAADAFGRAIELHGSSDETGIGLTLLENAAKSGQSVLPADVRISPSPHRAGTNGGGEGRAGGSAESDKIALSLALGTIDNITGRFAAANSLFGRLAKAANAPNVTPCRTAYAAFGSGMALEKLNKPAAAKDAFIASLKLYALGSWQDETLYRLALLIQAEAPSPVAGGADAGSFPAASAPPKPGVSAAGYKNPGATGNIEEQTLARDAKSDAAKQAALPYWQALLTKYPQSPRVDAAEYYGGIAASTVAGGVDPGPSHMADAGPDKGIALLQEVVKDHPTSPFVGDAAIRVIDVALEQMFDLKRAKDLSAAGLDWLKNSVAGGVDPGPPDAGKTGVSAAGYKTLAPWRRSGYEFTPTPPDRVKYELYLRAGLVAYLQGNYDDATAAFDAAGPEEPVSQMGGSVDIAHIGLHYLIKAAHTKKAVTTDLQVWRDTTTDQQKTAVNLGNVYLEGIRPDKADEVFARILNGDPVLGRVSNALKGYAILQLGVAIDREGRRNEALDWFRELAYSPQFAGTFWQPYGLFRLAVFTHNFTQDQHKSMPIYREMLEKYPDHPEAEDALFFYMQDAMEIKDYKLARVLGDKFRAKYPKSWWMPACNQYLSQISTGGSQ